MSALRPWRKLSQHAGNNLGAAGHSGQALVASVDLEAEFLVLKPERRQKGRMQVAEGIEGSALARSEFFGRQQIEHRRALITQAGRLKRRREKSRAPRAAVRSADFSPQERS